MEWTTPAYDEIKMDAEIGSYQEDGEQVPIVKARVAPPEQAQLAAAE
jgi:hypothetical protein